MDQIPDPDPPLKHGDPNAPVPTWEQLAAAEPRLGHLLVLAESMRPAQDGFCAHRIWFGPEGLRRRTIGLVGWHAASDNNTLHGSKAYQVAYRKLYDALPDCMHEGMC
jgi:hypothetical protein